MSFFKKRNKFQKPSQVQTAGGLEQIGYGDETDATGEPCPQVEPSESAEKDDLIENENGHPQVEERPPQALNDPEITIGWCEIFTLIVSMLLAVADYVSDIVVAVENYGRPKYFVPVISFIIIPTVVTAIYDIWWYCHEHKQKRETDDNTAEECDPNDNNSRKCDLCFAMKLLPNLILLGCLLRKVVAIMYAVKNRRANDDALKRKFFRRCRRESDVGDKLLLFEKWLEAAPQLIIQICILMIERNPDWKSVGSIILSALALSYSNWSIKTIAPKYRQNPVVEDGFCQVGGSKLCKLDCTKIRCSAVGRMVSFLVGSFCGVSSRVLIISALATVFWEFVVTLIGLHGLLSICWLMVNYFYYGVHKRTQLDPSKCMCVVKLVMIGLAWCISYLSIQERSEKTRNVRKYARPKQVQTGYYAVFVLENVVMAVVYMYCGSKMDDYWIYNGVGAYVIVAQVPMLVSRYVYYTRFHIEARRIRERRTCGYLCDEPGRNTIEEQEEVQSRHTTPESESLDV